MSNRQNSTQRVSLADQVQEIKPQSKTPRSILAGEAAALKFLSELYSNKKNEKKNSEGGKLKFLAGNQVTNVGRSDIRATRETVKTRNLNKTIKLASVSNKSGPKYFYYQREQTFGALLKGNSFDVLRELPNDCFNVAVTSPPYYWARDYGYDEQIGHEDKVDEFVCALADVFDEVRRVLHPEGAFFLNIGDTYYSGNGQPHGHDPRCSSRSFMRKKLRAVDCSGWDIPKKA